MSTTNVQMISPTAVLMNSSYEAYRIVRQIVLDTETTGLDANQGHRIIEIGGVEIIDRKLTGNRFHHYLQPDRAIDKGAVEVHGINNEFLLDKPHFDAIVDSFLTFVSGAELIIHNAPFDLGFINAELSKIDKPAVESVCSVLDTLVLARKKYPGQRNNLDALCKRLGIDNSQRTLHGALLDAEILADIYLSITGGQTSLSLTIDPVLGTQREAGSNSDTTVQPIPVVHASQDELAAHAAWIEKLERESRVGCVWRR